MQCSKPYQEQYISFLTQWNGFTILFVIECDRYQANIRFITVVLALCHVRLATVKKLHSRIVLVLLCGPLIRIMSSGCRLYSLEYFHCSHFHPLELMS